MEERKENKMGIMPVNRLLVTMSLPMMISMLVQALYNIVDSLFVSRINEQALTALSLAFPVQNLMIAVSAGMGVGMNALLSRSLGEKNGRQADKAAMNGLFLALINYSIFLIFGLFGTRWFYSIQTSDPLILQYGTEYLRLCCLLSFGMMFQMTLEKILQATGRTMYTMLTQSLGAVINIIFDPIMIFGYFGCPAMGVTGAAAATVFGQIVSMSLALWFNRKKNPDVTLKLRGFRPEGKTIGLIYRVGIPSIIMQAISSVMNFGMNRILLSFTSTAAAVFGAYFKLQSFVFMPIFGMNNGIVPITAYNYGAGKGRRINRVVRLGIRYATCIMTAGLLIMELFPAQVLGFFDASPAMLEIGVPALRIIAIHFVAAGYGIVCSSVFQALGHGLLSMTVSLCRQLFVLLPAAWLLAHFFGLSAVWWAFPIAECSAVLLSTLFLRRIYRLEILPIYEPEETAIL